MKKTNGMFLGLLIALLGLVSSPIEIRAQSQYMNPNYNPHNRNWHQPRRDHNDPRYRRHPSGGSPREFNQKYSAQAAAGHFWRVTSDCASACTIGFGHFSKNRMCIARGIRLGFHHGNNPTSTAIMWASYPADVKALVNARGGMRPEWLWIPASAFHAIGYKPC